MPTEEEKKWEAEAFAKEAVCASRQPHGKPQPAQQGKEEDHEEEKGHTEAAEAPRLAETPSGDDSGAEGHRQPEEPSEEGTRTESPYQVGIGFEDGDDEDDDFADDADWQNFQQSQKQVG